MDRKLIVVLALVVAACSKKNNDANANGTGARPTPSAVGGGTHVVHARIAGKELDFPYGRAFPRLGGVHVVLSNKPTSCAQTNALEASASLEIDLPPGPRGDFFTGAPIGVELWFHDAERSSAQGHAAPWQTTVKLDHPPSDRVAGTIDFVTKSTLSAANGTTVTNESTGNGAFDVELCDRAALVVSASNEAPKAPDAAMSGSLGGADFTPKSVIATVWKDPSTGESFVHSLALYPSAGVDCGTRFVHERMERVVVFQQIGGVSEKRTLGGPQPAAAFVSAPTATGDGGPTASLRPLGSGTRAWVRFDAIDWSGLKEGNTLKGAAAAANDEGAAASDIGHVDGAFSALVCTT